MSGRSALVTILFTDIVGSTEIAVADREGQTIRRVDPVTDRTDPPIRMPGPVAAIGVDAATGEVWPTWTERSRGAGC